ncbi:hypothetical protein E3Q17_04447 [Wallemia mellicola]|uniref:Uncharacterized protein n=1 Tax=Wallemia mellicola TaxID=1708541 RepID=A0A4T0NCH9_9BASI|nr:hypothetical protein E3Q19_04473 [Wallemia mellicola]TIB94514.1 hypothetical protein E3Q17_04447 [Wallemia mellicola]TIC35521.1 hypothetical protein E3Q08_04450 [Wallemia mellicola]
MTQTLRNRSVKRHPTLIPTTYRHQYLLKPYTTASTNRKNSQTNTLDSTIAPNAKPHPLAPKAL